MASFDESIDESVDAAVAVDEEVQLAIVVVDREGVEHRLAAEPGWRVMEVIRDWGLDIKAECGGALACATCHVHVDRKWVSALQPPSEEEIEMLDEAFDVREDSRLSCQILMTPELHGLRVQLAPGTER